MDEAKKDRNPVALDGIVSAIGNTPLIRLRRIIPDAEFEIFAKLDFLNPGGSSKDRAAYNVIQKALEEGVIDQNSVIIESSSGNMGIGLAQVCRYFGLRFICVVDAKTTRQNISVLRAYGAEVDIITEPEKETGEFLQSRIKRVQSMCKLIENSFWPSQYSNPDNAGAYYKTTMRELVKALDGQIDYLFCGTSTCGTIRGCSDFVQEHRLPVRIIAVDAEGSQIFKNQRASRRIPGLGASIRPQLFRPDMVDRCIHVNDAECIAGCRRLVDAEGILTGGSAGGVIMAINKIKADLPKASKCVAILADRGDRYLDTIYSDTWVTENFGNIEHLWSRAPELDRSYPRTTPAQPAPVGTLL